MFGKEKWREKILFHIPKLLSMKKNVASKRVLIYTSVMETKNVLR